MMPNKQVPPTRYCVVDDAAEERVRPLLQDMTRSNAKLTMDRHQPTRFEDELKTLKSGDYSGYLLDLRLGENANEETGERAQYSAQSLAQELRTRMTVSSLQPAPVVLWSTDSKITNYFNKDDTAKDLFDLVYNKDDIGARGDEIAVELIDLADAYRTVVSLDRRKTDAFTRVYGVKIDEIMDDRVVAALSLSGDRSVHEIVRTALNELVSVPGPLVSEHILAARLGVDFLNSPDWGKLTNVLKNSRYRGIFSTAWPRWWWSSIERWWTKDLKNDRDLMRLDADERVDRLKMKLNLKDLVYAKPDKHNASSKFWTICYRTKVPLDPAEAFRFNSVPDRQPWQDKAYLSLNSLLERNAKPSTDLYPFDRDRFNAAKKRVKIQNG